MEPTLAKLTRKSPHAWARQLHHLSFLKAQLPNRLFLLQRGFVQIPHRLQTTGTNYPIPFSRRRIWCRHKIYQAAAPNACCPSSVVSASTTIVTSGGNIHHVSNIFF